MPRRRFSGWLVVLTACLMASPALAQDDTPPPGVSFKVNSGAVYATTDTDAGGRLRVRFRGEGQADLTRASATLALEELTQVNGSSTLTVTADGDLTRPGRARVYVGTGTATVTQADGDVTFEQVRIVISLRGRGHRLRLIGKYVGVEPVDTADTPPDVLRGVIRGRPIPTVEPTE